MKGQVMTDNFGEKKLHLAEIIENRRIDGAKEDSNPTKFSFVKTDTGLKCIWSSCLTPPETANKLFDTTITDKGLSSEDWDYLTKKLSEFL
jgi:hypothetical protein